MSRSSWNKPAPLSEAAFWALTSGVFDDETGESFALYLASNETGDRETSSFRIKMFSSSGIYLKWFGHSEFQKLFDAGRLKPIDEYAR